MSELEEEVFSINAIYGDCMQLQSPGIYVIRPPCCPAVSILVSFHSTYPATPPSLLSVTIPDDVSCDRDIGQTLAECYRPGEVCVFDFLDALNQVLRIDDNQTTSEDGSEDDRGDLDWSVSDIIEDRKSRFEGRAIAVTSVQDAKTKLAMLKSVKRISKASHNMTAWRIRTDTGVTYQDCDDDGESAAGGRYDMWNVMVVVSRWFGGTHIGPDRFKHINVAAREALVKGGFVPDKDKKDKAGKRKSKR